MPDCGQVLTIPVNRRQGGRLSFGFAPRFASHMRGLTAHRCTLRLTQSLNARQRRNVRVAPWTQVIAADAPARVNGGRPGDDQPSLM